MCHVHVYCMLFRYSHYRAVLAEFSTCVGGGGGGNSGGGGVIFGHHKGDIQENVISNVMKGATLLNLNG